MFVTCHVGAFHAALSTIGLSGPAPRSGRDRRGELSRGVGLGRGGGFPRHQSWPAVGDAALYPQVAMGRSPLTTCRRRRQLLSHRPRTPSVQTEPASRASHYQKRAIAAGNSGVHGHLTKEREDAGTSAVEGLLPRLLSLLQHALRGRLERQQLYVVVHIVPVIVEHHGHPLALGAPTLSWWYPSAISIRIVPEQAHEVGLHEAPLAFHRSNCDTPLGGVRRRHSDAAHALVLGTSDSKSATLGAWSCRPRRLTGFLASLVTASAARSAAPPASRCGPRIHNGFIVDRAAGCTQSAGQHASRRTACHGIAPRKPPGAAGCSCRADRRSIKTIMEPPALINLHFA